MKTETLFSRKSDEWETPGSLFDELDHEFHFDLDACATDENHKCNRYYTIADNGLVQNWGGHKVWCNPPYSDVKRWVRKCYYEGHKPNTIVVCLVFSRTDTRWWQNYVQHRAEVRFIKGRIKFGGKANAPFPSALVIYRGPEEKMTQYCRYCTYMCCGDANYCSIRKKTYSDSYIKKPNKCRDFDLNPIDALQENKSGYKPRKHLEKRFNQISLSEYFGEE